MDEKQLQLLRLQAEINRRRLVEIVDHAKAGHIGGGLSSINLLTALYSHLMNHDPKNPKMDNRDRFILSKGHCVEALYSVLESQGYIDNTLTNTYGECKSLLAGHPTIKVPGVEVNSGALGHGLSIGIGMALAAKMDIRPYRTFVLMGDGEQGEGSIYEAAMAARHYGLDNLVAIIDRNKLQISGTTEQVMSLDRMRQIWEGFGWDVIETNGDQMQELLASFASIDYNNGKPHLIISHSTKGCGISYMENGLKWHHGVPTPDQYKQAIEEIESRIQHLSSNL